MTEPKSKNTSTEPLVIMMVWKPKVLKGRRWKMAVAVVAALWGFPLIYPVLSGSGGQGFVPPDIATASDILYPVNSTATGIVTFLLNISRTARVQNLQVLRDIPSLTSTAQTAFQNWTFTPATLNGNPVSANLSLSVVFCPYNPGGTQFQNMPLPPPRTPLSSTAQQFKPAQITSASFAIYPINSVSKGAAVLDVTVGKGGRVTSVQVIHDVPSLTQPAIQSLNTWGFSSATYQGQPIASQMIIAIVFQPMN